jgi:hypothetical protein
VAISTDEDTAFTGTVGAAEPGVGGLRYSLHDPTPAATERFGTSVAASDSFVGGGAPYASSGPWNPGTAYVFDAATGDLVRALTNPDPQMPGDYGTAVAISGSTVVVGNTAWGASDIPGRMCSMPCPAVFCTG